jgi:predicted esterase
MTPTRRARSTRAGAFFASLLFCGCAPFGSLDSPFTSEFTELAVPGHNAAIVSLPRGATRPRPLIVAAHGAGDRAEWHCELWRRIVGDGAFVLCPQGRRTDERVPHADASYFYPHHFALDKEVEAAVRALGERYRELVDAKSAVYTGFSQGAIHGSQVIVLHPDRFPRAALVEGGNGFFNEWSPYAARRFAKGGGQRVLFGCGSPACVRTAEKCAGYLRKTGVEARVAHAEGAGHSYGPPMEDELRENFEWLVAGDPRWAPE